MASTSVPVAITSPSGVDRSNTISAPTFCRDMVAQASQTALMALSHWCISSVALSSDGPNTAPSIETRVRPTCSSTLRSSGWKRTISAMAPIWKTFCIMKMMLRSCRMLAAR